MTAPMVLDGPMKAAPSAPTSSRCWRRRCATATSSSWTTCPPTRAPAIPRRIEAAGATLRYLPPYSPDFNPIENAFAKLKASCARPPHAPSRTSGTPSATPSRRFTPTDCANYFTAAGYEPD